MGGVDFHVHTYEGSKESVLANAVVDRAIIANLDAIAITDHCSIAGIDAAIEAAGNNIEIVPGVELDAKTNGDKIHILSYLMDHKDPFYLKAFDKISKGRRERIRKMVRKFTDNDLFEGKPLLSKDDAEALIYGLDINKIYTTNAIADMIIPIYIDTDTQMGAELKRLEFIDEYTTPKGTPKGKLDLLSKFMYEYLGPNSPCYSPYEAPHFVEVMMFCNEFNSPYGFAHIGYDLKDKDKIRAAVEVGARTGMNILGVGHKHHTEDMTNFLSKLAKEFNLIPVNGSDYHAKKGQPGIGDYRSPYKILERIKALKG